ncbi:hypothetical protein N665_0168s0013 [Sinapis alba]|nr:hypothetical protein N665_0168s0013 [Sinapis alba]
MNQKKKRRPPLRGSTKMARLAGVSKVTKSSVAAKSQKKSSLAGEVIADAVIVTNVTEGTTSAEGISLIKSPILVVEEPINSSRTIDSVSDASNHETTLVAEGILAPIEAQETLAVSGEEVNTRLPSGEKNSIGPSEPPASAATSDAAAVNPSQVHVAQNYASLLKVSAKLEELGTPSEHVSGAPFVLIPDENIESAKEEFKDFIFARFHGEYPAMGRIIGVVNAIWAKAGPRIYVHNIGDGCYLLRVTNLKAKEALLSRTCWNIAGFPMFVAPWSPDFAPEEAPITSAVVPVELRNVPYLLFNRESLSRLATAVGKPVSLAPETERKENFQVAKLYVRVDLTKQLPSKIISGFSSGRKVEISVSYPWLPVKFSKCGKYGHSSERCRSGLVEANAPGKRERSTSANKDKARHYSRPSRNREKKHSPFSEVALVNSQSKVEEGEIVVLKDYETKGTEIAKISEESSNVAVVGIEYSRDSAHVNQSGSTLQQDGLPPSITGTNCMVITNEESALTKGKSDSDSHEAPFFLVNRRKSGRKVTPTH